MTQLEVLSMPVEFNRVDKENAIDRFEVLETKDLAGRTVYNYIAHYYYTDINRNIFQTVKNIEKDVNKELSEFDYKLVSYSYLMTLLVTLCRI